MRQGYRVPPMCCLPCVSMSSYYGWRKRKSSKRARQEARLEAEVLVAHRRTRQRFEPQRLQQHLEERGVRIGVHQIRWLRKRLGLLCNRKCRFKATTQSKHDLSVAPNLLNQDFSARAPNQAWCGDITFIATDEGWLYLAGVKDLYSGEIVDYTMSELMTKNLVMQALFRAVAIRRPPSRLIHHTDRGSQYCALTYQSLVGQSDMQPSMIPRQLLRQCTNRIITGSAEERTGLSSTFATREQTRQAIREHSEIFYIQQCTQARLNFQSISAFTQRFYLNQVAA